MAKKINGKGEEKHHGFLDRVLHGDSSEGAFPEGESESDLPIESPAPKSKKNSDEGASSESKHHHKKFDKFKKGN